MSGPERPDDDLVADHNRLHSWKEIAAYLKHAERTVRRWEATEGLPVHRHIHAKRGSVYAFRSELDEWLRTRSQPARADTPSGQRISWKVAALLLLATVASALLMARWWWPLDRRIPSPIPVPSPLTTYLGNELEPMFSPDGNDVAFSWDGQGQDNYDIYVRSITQDRPLRLTTSSAHDFSPAWSADGRTIAFLRVSPRERVLIIAVPASGGPERTLAEFYFDPVSFIKFPTRFLSWHPKLRRLAVAARTSAQEPHAIWAIDDSGHKSQLTHPPREFAPVGDLNPVFRPGGQELLFTRGKSRFTCEAFLLPLGSQGGAIAEAKSVAPGKVSIITPAWLSADEIVFQLLLEQGLWQMHLDNPRELTPLPFARWYAEFPTFSESRRRLAFAAGGSDHNIWRMVLSAPDRLAGTPVRAVASTHQEGVSAISPDGRRMAFMSTRSGNYEVWSSDLDGQNAMRLTEHGGGVPAWSPDGRWISFESRRNGRADVFAVPATSGRVRRLTADPADEVSSSWSGDGAWIYFSSNRSGRWEVWKTHWETGREVQVTTDGGLGARESPDQRYLYYVKHQPGAALGLLHRTALSTGREERVLADLEISSNGFLPLNSFVYLIAAEKQTGENWLLVSDLQGGAIKQIAPVGKGFTCCLAVTGDGRWMFYTRAEEKGYDLMLVENFR